jgi:rRNA maturation endonuclease Nob1
MLEAAVPTGEKGKGKGKYRAKCSGCGKEFSGKLEDKEFNLGF